MYKSSFTMIELIIVIITTGILAITIIPRLERAPLVEATEQVLRHIRYTQQLALVNDIYNTTEAKWYKAMWRISFRSNNCYVVSSNTDLDMNYDRDESTTDPLTKTLLYSNTDCILEPGDDSKMLLFEKYGIDRIEFSRTCGNNRFIAFDYMGRPHKTLTSANDFIISECLITLHAGLRKAVISILPETGYVKVLSFE
ncbi:type II secretion system protein [Sulfurimonas sp. HSL3-7]|uniref:pilus assembly FimT family protein n=1 Tax=Sulfonitrofixus jiaomeiensis TaxID=3131938 RepID=UPI0031FA3BA8